MENKIIIYTDGSSRGNPGRGGWGAVLILEAKNNQSKVESEKSQVVEIGGRENHTTNNRMELTATICSLSLVRDRRTKDEEYEIEMYVDSQYVINGITKWIHGWRRNGWKTKSGEVLNQDLWQELGELNDELAPSWQYVAGHAGTAGNERADEIATAFADGVDAKLYDGLLDGYPHDLSQNDNSDESKKSKSDTKNRSGKGKAYSYVSMVDGDIETHETWSECEERVKGARGAKFRKALSEEDEKDVITEFRSA